MEPHRHGHTNPTVDNKILASNFGQPLADMTHSLNIGGHVVSSDVYLNEKQQTFNRHKIVERMVHPCGAGAFGYFEVTQPVAEFTKAKFLDTVGKQTPIFVRFSTVTPGREFPDCARNPRGFAIKFYTEEGNYDLVGLNFPIFFVRDPALGPDVIMSQRRNPANFLLDWQATFDFMSLVPESVHCATMMFSDHGTPYGFRFIPGYGAHTFKWVNQAGESFYIKYHFISEQGVKNFDYKSAKLMCGEDPDFAKRDLWENIEKGNFPAWKCCVQIMPAAEAINYRFDPFDVTKVWPHSDYPLREFGRLVLNRNPENYHRDVEQAAFSPGSLVPGIELSPDPVLQYRAFFYRDAQFYRLGVNLHQIPVNCPFRSQYVHHQGRDGLMRVDNNGTLPNGMQRPTYYPNSLTDIAPTKTANPSPVLVSGVLDRMTHTKHELNPEDDFLQVRELFSRVMSQEQKDHLYYNIAECLKFANSTIQQRCLASFYKVHPDYAKGVAARLGHSFSEKEMSSASALPIVDRSNVYHVNLPSR